MWRPLSKGLAYRQPKGETRSASRVFHPSRKADASQGEGDSMSRTENNLRYYNKTRRKVHAGPRAPLCRMAGPVGSVVTCKTCLMVQKARAVGSRINEWEQKRLDAMFRKQSAERSAKWRANNLEKARAASRRWRERNLDVMRVNQREWYVKNRDHVMAYQRNRRARSSTEAQA
jgi:hypothetical protein